MQTMKGVIFNRYGAPEVLKQAILEKPIPKDNDVLIRIHATTVSAGDWRMRKADPFLARLVNGLFVPYRIKILGFELSGQVEAVGHKVTRFKAGDQVFASTGFKFGAYAQFITLNENAMIAKKPHNMSHCEAAGVPVGANTALYFLRDKAHIKRGQKVLIYGASGTVGSFAVQIAKFFGAEVTGVCSTTNIEMVRSLGADTVKDYTSDHFNLPLDHFDIIFDAVGKSSKSALQGSIRQGGQFVSVHQGTAKQNATNLDFLREMIESGKLRAVIDKHYSLDQIIEAHQYVEKGHKKGNVIIHVR